MYYIKLVMKNIIFKLLEYIYYFSLVIIFVIYLFPGSLIGYFLYGNLGQQPNVIPNPIGTSINHFIYFSYITILATFIKTRVNNIFTDYKIILFVAFILEILHFIVPKRAIEYNDLLENMFEVIIVLLTKKIIK